MSLGNFGELKTAAYSAMGRDDIPDYVWTLMMKTLNRDGEFLDQEDTETIMTTSNPMNLPRADGGSLTCNKILAANLISGTSSTPLRAITAVAAGSYSNTGRPTAYAISSNYQKTDDQIIFHPPPDGEYEIEIRFVFFHPNFGSDTSKNFLLLRYPDLFLYSALMHAGVWAKDMEMASIYTALYKDALKEAKDDDRTRRGGDFIETVSSRL
jgi:hypothetical protein